MADDHSDPEASPEPSRPIVESIAPAEPETPAWLTWVGFVLFLLALGWFAARCNGGEPGTGNGVTQPVPSTVK